MGGSPTAQYLPHQHNGQLRGTQQQQQQQQQQQNRLKERLQLEAILNGLDTIESFPPVAVKQETADAAAAMVMESDMSDGSEHGGRVQVGGDSGNSMLSSPSNGDNLKAEAGSVDGGDSAKHESMDTRSDSGSSGGSQRASSVSTEENMDTNENPPSAIGVSPSDRIAKMKETISRCELVVEKHNAYKRGNQKIMEDELSGARELHPLNRIGTASYLQVKFVWKMLFMSIPELSEWLLTMARALPGFKNLCQADQAVMLEGGYFELWMLQSSAFFHQGESYLRLPYQAAYSRFWMRHFLTENLVNSMFKFAEDLNNCRLTETELIIVCAITLTDPDRKGLQDMDSVRTLHNHYLDVLAYLIQDSHPAHHSRILINLFRILPLLAPLNAEQVSIIGQFCIDTPVDGVIKYDAESTDTAGIPEEVLEEIKNEDKETTEAPSAP